MGRGRTPGARVFTPESANHEAKKATALEMLIAGHSQVEIGRMLGVAQPTVSRWVRKALSTHQRRAVEEYQALEEQRLDKLAGILWRKIERPSDPQAVPAAHVMVRVMDRRAKLLGLDAADSGTGAGRGIGAGKNATVIFGTDAAGAESAVLEASLAAFAETFYRLAPDAIVHFELYPLPWAVGVRCAPGDPGFEELARCVDQVRAAHSRQNAIDPGSGHAFSLPPELTARPVVVDGQVIG